MPWYVVLFGLVKPEVCQASRQRQGSKVLDSAGYCNACSPGLPILLLCATVNGWMSGALYVCSIFHLYLVSGEQA